MKQLVFPQVGLDDLLVVLDLLRRAFGDLLAVVDHHDAVAKLMTAVMLCSIIAMVTPLSRMPRTS